MPTVADGMRREETEKAAKYCRWRNRERVRAFASAKMLKYLPIEPRRRGERHNDVDAVKSNRRVT